MQPLRFKHRFGVRGTRRHRTTRARLLGPECHGGRQGKERGRIRGTVDGTAVLPEVSRNRHARYRRRSLRCICQAKLRVARMVSCGKDEEAKEEVQWTLTDVRS